MSTTIIPFMQPAPGERLVRFVGDHVRFELRDNQGRKRPAGWKALLRTNIGRAELLRREILDAHTRGLPLAGASWRDLPMRETVEGWALELPLAETGYFQAKAYLVDPAGWQHWPAGPDVGLSVHPDLYRTGNTIYCAFTRLFGLTRHLDRSARPEEQPTLKQLEREHYAVIPPSGTFRDLQSQFPHIFGTLGCRILHLLPINPTPTTYARFGQYGSPYAALDLKAVDPALVVFDKRTTGVDQFRELTYQAHLRGGRVILDIVINHTGWGSVLQENHPEWFLRNADGTFASPGAWGTTWEDLVELKHHNVELWDDMAEVFLTWCRRGVDGFRCDAGYKVPVQAWQYIVARVQQEYPDALFLLEGLGGAWEATSAILGEGGMQWAYSELFQNYNRDQVGSYLGHALAHSARDGLLVHYSETHDNERLAARGRGWSLLRNRLCALLSMSGGFGYTCGVEWLAAEKVRVHGSTGLAWGSTENIVPELARLTHLLNEHPCFFDGADIRQVETGDSPVLAWVRRSAEGADVTLVLVNTDEARSRDAELGGEITGTNLPDWVDLLDQAKPHMEKLPGGGWRVSLKPGGAFCLSPFYSPVGLHGNGYREARARAAFATKAMQHVRSIRDVPVRDWRELAQAVDESPEAFLKGLRVDAEKAYTNVITWTLHETRRVLPVPPDHWLLISDSAPFRASLQRGSVPEQRESIRANGRHIAVFCPKTKGSRARLFVERYSPAGSHVEGDVLFLEPEPTPRVGLPAAAERVLLTNGRGGMARMCVDLGRVISKYDAVLAANLHPELPVDRHVFAKRIRIWANADGFISPLNAQSLHAFEAGPPASWRFVANAGDGRSAEIKVLATMLPGRNTTVFRFHRAEDAESSGTPLPSDADLRLTVRLDIEDRNFHTETKFNGGTEHHFTSNTRNIPSADGGARKSSPGEATQWAGFDFQAAADRRLRAYATAGCYHAQSEWSMGLPHVVEQTRGQEGCGDAFSPGWFELPLAKGEEITLVITADAELPLDSEIDRALAASGGGTAADFAEALETAIGAFVVRRGAGKTVVAGYPWFLDWGRDTFICARGLLSAGRHKEVRQIIETFARFEDRGTLPNTIHGNDASNRDTSDAPLWFGVVCEETAAVCGAELFDTKLDEHGRTLEEVLRSIAVHYMRGTPNGIHMDPESALIWSPAHFTWMDTNYPAATPREGYPVEIQALWIRLLRLLAHLKMPGVDGLRWDRLADKALKSVEDLFWLEDHGFYADVLRAHQGTPARQAVAEDALRSNCLFLISLDLATGERARRCVASAQRWLVVPGALRTLAPLTVKVPVPVIGNHGGLLNDPHNPYWGRYEGDEDTRRKPSYHNGTAWTWTFPVFCEALWKAYGADAAALGAAQAYLGSMRALLDSGCIGQLPEIVDGDAPHCERGCDAQAWGATEALRVAHLLRMESEGRT